LTFLAHALPLSEKSGVNKKSLFTDMADAEGVKETEKDSAAAEAKVVR
jgi:hypothetical protein